MTYNEQLQDVASQDQAATGALRFRSAEVGAWAIENGLWQPSREAILHQFSSELSRALREEHIEDPQGRRIRATLSAKLGNKGDCGRTSTPRQGSTCLSRSSSDANRSWQTAFS